MCVLRYLGTLKSYVRNKAHPEGSIAEGYLAEECLTFCSQYLEGIETKSNRPARNSDDTYNQLEPESSIFSMSGRPLGKKGKKAKSIMLDDKTWVQAHRYVLFNCDSIAPFRE